MAMSIEDAVALAVSTHPTVNRSKASMRAAEQERVEAAAGWYPTLDVNADAGWEHSENYFTRNDGESGDSKDLFRKLAGGELVQNIFSGGRTVAETAAAGGPYRGGYCNRWSTARSRSRCGRLRHISTFCVRANLSASARKI